MARDPKRSHYMQEYGAAHHKEGWLQLIDEIMKKTTYEEKLKRRNGTLLRLCLTEGNQTEKKNQKRSFFCLFGEQNNILK